MVVTVGLEATELEAGLVPAAVVVENHHVVGVICHGKNGDEADGKSQNQPKNHQSADFVFHQSAPP